MDGTDDNLAVVNRMARAEVKHAALHDWLADLARIVWGMSALVVEAEGVGARLASPRHNDLMFSVALTAQLDHID